MRLNTVRTSEYFNKYGKPKASSEWGRFNILAGNYEDVDLLARIIMAESGYGNLELLSFFVTDMIAAIRSTGRIQMNTQMLLNLQELWAMGTMGRQITKIQRMLLLQGVDTMALRRKVSLIQVGRMLLN